MCYFCDLLYFEDQADDKLFNEGAADLVYFDDDGELNIQVDTGDPYESGILSNITYCPYCGRNLKEQYGLFVKGMLKEKMGENDTECKEPSTENVLGHNLCDSCTNIGCEFQSGIIRTKCSFYMPSVTPQEQEPFINKPCVSSGVCEYDKNKALNKIRAEIEKEADTSNRLHGISEIGLRKALKIIDKYKVGSEDT